MTGPQIEVLPDPDAVAARGATFVAEQARAAVADHGRFTFAVSGGHTPWAMFAELADEDVPWAQCASTRWTSGSRRPAIPTATSTHLLESLPARGRCGGARDAGRGATTSSGGRRLRGRPARRGSTSSTSASGRTGTPPRWCRATRCSTSTDRDVGVTDVYMGRRRMTLTYPVLDRAAQVLWLVTGADKVDALATLRAGDRSIPAGRVGGRARADHRRRGRRRT